MPLRLNKTPAYSDLELIAKYQNSHDNFYVGELFQRYTHLVFGVCMKYLKNKEDSQDAVMGIFEKLIDDLKRHEIDNFKSWLYSVSKNFCLMQLRSQRAKQKKEATYKKSNEEFMELACELHLNNKEHAIDDMHNLHQAIDMLKYEQKRCVELFYLKEKNYREVAEQTGYTIKQVKSYLQNGKRNLKNHLDNKHE